METLSAAPRAIRLGFALLLGLCAVSAQAAPASGKSAVAYGRAGDKWPGWSIVTDVPSGWTADCCDHARWVGVPMVIYRGDWTGKPEGVMVLNVWLSHGQTLEQDLDKDRDEYRRRDPKATIAALSMPTPRGVTCSGVRYHGSDGVEDAVMFCDPGQRTGIHYSWSISIGEKNPQRAATLNAFAQVVAHSRYLRYDPASGPPPAESGKK
ncbi:MULTISPECIES: hypothetical protein [Oleiagrimonas]|jgi:hypothetical protein|uniref:Uncharacterized protein n=1 Tax=Oleiagrimonas citrea TaxID=1665687 RepID=A0A846ZP77_9GAMM|nr:MULTISPECIES: hypothetical protein [Oleiagrimonas]NKZ39329.1 hypothetical protein [Oleiagrimonas citrea]RAP59691.1 hypothetical protein BTJ49_03375 [Oleiagrimonas sp. MCCC 1A03011]